MRDSISKMIGCFFRFALLSALLQIQVVESAEVLVDRNGSGDFTSLSDAVIQSLSNGESDIITVKSGTYVSDQNVGEILTFIGSDDITIQGENSVDRPIIVIQPNIDNMLSDNIDGVVIQMGGALTFENLIFIPSEAFTIDENIDDLFAVFNAGGEGNPSSLDLTFRNVLITHSDIDHQPVTSDGFDDPRFWDNTFRDDAINVDANGPPDEPINLLLDNVVITGYGQASDSDALVLDGPQIDCTITGGSRFTYIRRRGIFAYNVQSLTIEGSDENPIIVYGAGETLIRASAGLSNWKYLWCVGLNEGDNGITTGFAARIDPNGGASVVAANCIFSTAQYDGMFMNFDSESPLSYEFHNCTFHNVPQLIRFGYVGEAGPSENVQMTVFDSIVDNADWTAPNDGTYWAPEPTVVHYGDGDNTLAILTLNNLAYRTQTFVSSASGSRTPNTENNIIEVDDFQFVSEELSRNTLNTFLVAANDALLEGKGANGSYLGGARVESETTDVFEWPLY
ncbi:MAG: hypothetical protein JXR73_13975 [Candidatus Omnitrophica bacterium]|nr:hypothetical protein [Candidatus Omnitrophota bacterium]